jgi:LytS/YehU family sensor histidine kinase
LHLRVRDFGAGPCSAAPAGRGLGLSNLRARLEQLYGADADLRIDISADGATVDVVVPYHRHVVADDLAVSMQGLPR